MDVNTNINENIRIAMSGEQSALPTDTFDPQTEAKKLMELMVRSGVLSGDEVNALVGRQLPAGDIVDADVIGEEDE